MWAFGHFGPGTVKKNILLAQIRAIESKAKGFQECL